MRLSFVKISIAVFTFLIGITAIQCWNVLSINEFQIENLKVAVVEHMTIETTTCQLMDETDNFDGKFISFQATAYVIGERTIILYPNDCYTHTNELTYVQLELDSYSGAHNNLKTLLEGKNRNSRADFKEVDVRIIGVAKITHDAEGYKNYSIFPSEIKIISPFRKFEPKGAA